MLSLRGCLQRLDPADGTRGLDPKWGDIYRNETDAVWSMMGVFG